MAVQYVTCPLCGFEFDKQDTLCEHGCPLGALCSLLRCPSCDYEFPPRPQSVSWIGRLFRRQRARASGLPEGVVAVRELRGGDRGTVVCLGGGTPRRTNTLAVFGLVPGAEITVLQQRPSCVIRVGETELALDPEIADDIMLTPAIPQ